MMCRRTHAAWIAALLITSSCSLLSPRPDPTRHIVLASLRDLGETEAPAASKLHLGLGPVRVPEYLDRSELMVRASPTELRPSTAARWAEPLPDMLARVLADDLVQLLGPARLVAHPWYATDRPHWQIEVEVLRFEPAAKGEARLDARWWLRDLSGDAATVSHESRITEATTKSEPARLAESLSRAVATLAREIAAAVSTLEP